MTHTKNMYITVHSSSKDVTQVMGVCKHNNGMNGHVLAGSGGSFYYADVLNQQSVTADRCERI